VLNKLKLLQHFNFSFTKKLNNLKVKIPISHGVGAAHINQQVNWMDLLIKNFVSDDGELQSQDNQFKTFVDVGVNVGQTLLRLKTIAPKIDYLGFEPSSTCVAYVQKLIDINDFKNCTVLNAALSTELGIIKLHYDDTTDSRASIISEFRPDFFLGGESVLTLDYDSFYLDKKISFVKIDVEGAEYEVLKGMEQSIVKHQPIITCEVLDSHSLESLEFSQKRGDLLCKLLKSWNYKIVRLYTEPAAILDFEKVKSLEIVPWTFESLALNDYLFFPADLEHEVLGKLKEIMKR
jgi:FkbM family methyltransferase